MLVKDLLEKISKADPNSEIFVAIGDTDGIDIVAIEYHFVTDTYFIVGEEE